MQPYSAVLFNLKPLSWAWKFVFLTANFCSPSYSENVQVSSLWSSAQLYLSLLCFPVLPFFMPHLSPQSPKPYWVHSTLSTCTHLSWKPLTSASLAQSYFGTSYLPFRFCIFPALLFFPISFSEEYPARCLHCTFAATEITLSLSEQPCRRQSQWLLFEQFTFLSSPACNSSLLFLSLCHIEEATTSCFTKKKKSISIN